VVTSIRNKETLDVLPNRTEYTGPYQTKGAAKGMLTRLTYEYNYYGRKVTELIGHIEVVTGWEKVED
jgi:hypothetical protein